MKYAYLLALCALVGCAPPLEPSDWCEEAAAAEAAAAYCYGKTGWASCTNPVHVTSYAARARYRCEQPK